MATVVANLTAVLERSCEVRVLNNRKTTAEDRNLYQGVAAQLVLLWRLARLCMVDWPPDVVHIHTCSWFSFWRSCIDVALARLLRRRVLLHIHGGQFHQFLGSLSAPSAWFARKILKACTRVVVLGEGWKTLLDKWCDPAQAKVIVVPNGVPIQPVQGAQDTDVFTIVCLANYAPQKGQADLIKATAALRSNRPVKIALLGSETERGQRQRLVDLATKLGIVDQLDAPGPVVGEAKEAWWARATCFCLPSYGEGLPMAVLEAMSKGIPVIATRVGAVPEAVEDGREGLLHEPGDVKTLTAHLQALLDHPDWARSVGLAGRDKLIREFSLERSAACLLDVYTSVTRVERMLPAKPIASALPMDSSITRKHFRLWPLA